MISRPAHHGPNPISSAAHMRTTRRRPCRRENPSAREKGIKNPVIPFKDLPLELQAPSGKDRAYKD